MQAQKTDTQTMNWFLNAVEQTQKNKYKVYLHVRMCSMV